MLDRSRLDKDLKKISRVRGLPSGEPFGNEAVTVYHEASPIPGFFRQAREENEAENMSDEKST